MSARGCGGVGIGRTGYCTIIVLVVLETYRTGHSLRAILIGELFVHIIFDICFAQFFNLPYFPVFFINIGMLTNLIFLLLENFTNSDRTPPYIDTYLQLFPNFGKIGKNALR